MTGSRASYRLQFSPHFTFTHAVAALPYLAALGVSHLYCSPIFQATPGSLHGYDVTDPTVIRKELGGVAGWQALVAAARAHDLAIILDLVPNHMALESNPWWHDVLQHGPSSAYYAFFDLATLPDGETRIVLPVLGAPYGEELLAGRITLVVGGDGLSVAYGRYRFPVAPASLAPVLAFAGLPERGTAPVDPELHEAVIAYVNADARRLHALLEAQHYRLAWWRLARDESPYRRFFDVNGLIGVRVEVAAAFDATHALIREAVADGSVQGLRVDHVDGLAAPGAYLEKLRTLAPDSLVVVEKVLAVDEALPDWPVDGTTGYEFGAAVLRLMMPAESEAPATAFYRTFTGQEPSFAPASRDARRDVVTHWLAGDVQRVADILYARCQEDVRLRDYSRRDCTALVRELTIGIPVYRTYVGPGTITAHDRGVIDAALGHVRRERPDLPESLVEAAAAALNGGEHPLELEFVRRWQQLSTAVVAKGDEDTALYRHARFIALNDVGASPDTWSESPQAFHARVAAWHAAMPGGLRATTTHDSKRGEDVRARLTVVAEAWDTWTTAVAGWRQRASALGLDHALDRVFEDDVYQTLVGAWPIPRERVHAHCQKAAREGKRFTNWEQPVEPYEAAVRCLVDGIFDDDAWVSSIDDFVRALHPADYHKALAQVLIKLTVPGLPDVYQGSEGWTLTLTDPDNRGVVDFTQQAAALQRLDGMTPSALLTDLESGAAKLHVIRRTLDLARRHPGLRPDAAYTPLDPSGRAASSAFAYMRGDSLAVIVPLRTMAPAWQQSAVPLPPGDWRHVFTGTLVPGGSCRLADLFQVFPVALLERVAS